MFARYAAKTSKAAGKGRLLQPGQIHVIPVQYMTATAALLHLLLRTSAAATGNAAAG